MNLSVRRYDATPERTIGRLYVDDAPTYLAFTLEDPVRDGPKIQHETAIPAGLYEVILSLSNRFGKVMPELLDVPNFTGIRIHGGNTAADTSGCLLVGMTRTAEGIANCAPALSAVQGEIAHAISAGDRVWITITDALPEGTLVA